MFNIDSTSRWILSLINKEVVVATRLREANRVVILGAELRPVALFVARASRVYKYIENKYDVFMVLDRMEFTSVASIQEILEEMGELTPTGEFTPSEKVKSTEE